MPKPKILVFAGSVRSGSLNEKLAMVAARALEAAGSDVAKVSLADYPMPLYNGDLEAAQGMPESAVRLKELFLSSAGVLLASPEYNAGVTPLLKNTLDWVSRRQSQDEAPLSAFRNRAFALVSASNGGFGGMRGLLMLRQVLAVGTGALVIPEQLALSGAAKAFDEEGELTEETRRNQLKRVADALVAMAAHYA